MRSILIRHASIAIVIMFLATIAHAETKNKFTSFVLGLGVKKVLSDVQVRQGLDLVVAAYEEDKSAFITEQSTMTNVSVGNGRELLYTFRLNNRRHYEEDLAAAGSLQAYANFIRNGVTSNLCAIHGSKAQGVNQWYSRNNVTLVYEYFSPDNAYITTANVNPKKDC